MIAASMIAQTGQATFWLTSFHPFTLHHGVAVAVCVAIMVGVSLTGRAWRGTPRAESLRRAVAAFGIFYWIASNTWWCWPSKFDLEKSLPLQICDLAGLIGPAAILTGRRWLRALLYFWGFGLSTQGFVTPVLTVGADHTEYWLFWANHTVIVGTAVYDLVALGFRPAWRDYRTAVFAILGYLVVMLPFDIALGLNYGYIGDTNPENPTLIDKLGPWPRRLGPLIVIALGAMALFCLPWTLVQTWKRRREPSAER